MTYKVLWVEKNFYYPFG